MDNKIFDGMVVFCSVVEHGGFTAAAKTLNHTTSHVSKEVSRLEAKVGMRLMNRTTRKISLTESGRIFFENSRRIIQDAQNTYSQIQSAGDHPFGHLKISVPVMFAESCLNHWLPQFVAEYPDITHEVEVGDRRVDIIADGFDVVVRAGKLGDAALIAKKLMVTRQLTVASPEYLDVHGEPDNPQDLMQHSLVDFAYRDSSDIWEYQSADGRPDMVRIIPKISCNSLNMEIALAVSGFGITRVPQLAVEQQIGDGRLVPILEQYEKPALVFHAIYPSRQHLAPKVRVFIDFLAKKCSQRD